MWAWEGGEWEALKGGAWRGVICISCLWDLLCWRWGGGVQNIWSLWWQAAFWAHYLDLPIKGRGIGMDLTWFGRNWECNSPFELYSRYVCQRDWAASGVGMFSLVIWAVSTHRFLGALLYQVPLEHGIRLWLRDDNVPASRLIRVLPRVPALGTRKASQKTSFRLACLEVPGSRLVDPAKS